MNADLPHPAPAPARRWAWPSARALLVGLLALAGALAVLGVGAAAGLLLPRPAPADPAPASTASAASPPAPAASLPGAAAMVAQLEAKLKARPDDREGWAMLGRAYGVMGRDQEAVAVYRRLLALSPEDDVRQRAQAHADLGRALGKAGGRQLTPEADEQLKKALALDPGNVMAHALLGRVALQRGALQDAKRHWSQALEGVDQGHPFAQQLQQSITLVDEALAARQGASAPQPSEPKPATP